MVFGVALFFIPLTQVSRKITDRALQQEAEHLTGALQMRV